MTRQRSQSETPAKSGAIELTEERLHDAVGGGTSGEELRNATIKVSGDKDAPRAPQLKG